MNTNELPEYQIFSVLRQGQEEAIGPYSQDQLVELLNEGEISSSDFVFYEGLDGWKPISEVFDLHETIANFQDDGQDQQLVSEAFGQLSNGLAPEEDIFYIAVQDLPAIPLTGRVRLTSPLSVAITNQRICIIHHKIGGKLEFENYRYDDVCDAAKRIKYDDKKGTFSILLHSGERVNVEKIPAAQLDRLESLLPDLKPQEESAETA